MPYLIAARPVGSSPLRPSSLEEMRAAAIVGKDKSREAFMLIHMKRRTKATVHHFLSPTFGAVGRV